MMERDEEFRCCEKKQIGICGQFRFVKLTVCSSNNKFATFLD